MASAGTYALARAAKRMASLNLGAAKDAAAALTSYGLRSADASRVLSPALVVHLDKVRHNVKTMIHGQMGGNALKWRPHVKTVKTPAILRELIAAGVRRFKCATPREADVLCATLREAGVAGESDVLIAFPHVGPNLTRLGQVTTVLVCSFVPLQPLVTFGQPRCLRRWRQSTAKYACPCSLRPWKRWRMCRPSCQCLWMSTLSA